MKKRIAWILILAWSLVLLTGCGCEHEWVEATCTEPKTCSLCGETEGEALGHSWEEATCTEPKTCSLCGETEGEALGHTPGSWKEEKDYVHAAKYRTRQCTVCGSSVDHEYTKLDQLYHNGVFDLSPEEFEERLGLEFESFSGNTLTTSFISNTDYGALCGVYDGNFSSVAGVVFYDSSMNFASSKFSAVACTFFQSDAENIVRVVLGIVSSCDPSLSFDEAKELTGEIVNGSMVKMNGITYAFDWSKAAFVASLL